MGVVTRRVRHLALLVLFLSFFLITPKAHATDLTGKITNAQGGEPLGKVHVAITGTALTTITPEDGSFRIANAPAGKQVLQISAVGYRTISIPFESAATEDAPSQVTEFTISLVPDNFQRTERVEVNADIFQSPEWPAVGDMTLTSSELQQTSTVLINDPFRSLQALPGVSASGNNDLFAQFSVMGAPYANVGIYVDDVFVPNLLHDVPGVSEAPTLSLLTGGDVADMRLLPVAYPVRYADAAGAAVVIRTREGDPSPPLIHASVGMATSEFLGEGAFGPNHKTTWLLGARKSYIGYLERYFANSRFSEDGFYDANMKLTFALTPSQTLSLYATGGQLGIHDPNPPVAPPDQHALITGASDLAVARLGWKWVASPKLLLDARAAFVRSKSDQDSVGDTSRTLDREWSVGSNLSWSWGHGAILQAGYTLRRPHLNETEVRSQPPPPISSSLRFSDIRQDFYVQNSWQFWQDRVRLQGGVRWAKQTAGRERPITGQFSAAFRAASNTTLEVGWGRYVQLPFRGGVFVGGFIKGVVIGVENLPYLSSHYIAAVEQRLGERTRLRIEAFDRENESRADFYTAQFVGHRFVFAPLARSLVLNRDRSRGLQFLLQRRSENRLSGWIGYTFTQARFRSYQASLPPIGTYGFDVPSTPTEQDQPHTVNVFGSYRLTPTIRLSAKAFYGSGFPATDPISYNFLFNGVPIPRIGPYERLDLRGEKSWTFQRWKLSLYTELLNVTAHDNRRLQYIFLDPNTHKPTLSTGPGFPFVPTAGLGFDF